MTTMARNRAGRIGLAALFLGAYTVACESPQPAAKKCSPTNCDGCCTIDNVCKTGADNAFCGGGGGRCSACNSPDMCKSGKCQGGPACDAMKCPLGCCDTAGTCITAQSRLACGVGGAACAACASPQICNRDNGRCEAPLKDGGVDAAVCTQAGSLACDSVMGAWCDRIVTCCNASSTPCYGWAYDTQSCKGHYVSQGFNCAGAPYAGASVCQMVTDKCIGDVPLVACSDLLGGTAMWPASCNDFWTQF